MTSWGIRSVSAALAITAAIGGPAVAHAQDDDDEVGDAIEATALPETAAAKLGVGLRGRYVFMPKGVIELFLVSAESGVATAGFGLELVRRKADFDIVLGLEYENISPDEGFYQDEEGEDPDRVEFDGFAMLGLDVNFVWSTELAPKLHLRYGAGIGVAAVLGDVLQTDLNCPNLDDFNTCVVDPTGDQNEPSEDVPPVVPIVNVLLGARFDVLPNLSVNVETGFRNLFYAGLGATYFF